MQVIVTNACSNIAGVTPPNRRIPAEWEVFKSLFFQSQGLVDITAAQERTFAWISPEHGGFFTQAFTHLLCEPVSHSDENQDGQVSWREFFAKVQQQTNDLFLLGQRYTGPDRGDKDIRNYTDQTPAYFYLGDTERWKFFLKGGNDYYDSAIKSWEANKNFHTILQVLGKHANGKGTLNSVAAEYDKHANRLEAICKKFLEAEKCYKVGATIAFAQGEYAAYKSLNDRQNNALTSKNSLRERVNIHRTNATVYRATAAISR